MFQALLRSTPAHCADLHMQAGTHVSFEAGGPVPFLHRIFINKELSSSLVSDGSQQEKAPNAAKGGSQAVRIARGPDGTKGFAPGRGRALPPPLAAPGAAAPGSVRTETFFCRPGLNP